MNIHVIVNVSTGKVGSSELEVKLLLRSVSMRGNVFIAYMGYYFVLLDYKVAGSLLISLVILLSLAE